MSKFTTEVRFICETANGLTESQGFTSIQNILSTAAPTVFDFNFPIFDESYRLPLEIKILRHYYTREICEETVGLWKLRLSDRLNMIMPYYNKLYESELLKFNPFYDVDLTTVHKKENSGNENREKDANESRVSVDKNDKTQTVEGNRSEDAKYRDINHTENESSDELTTNKNKNSDTLQVGTSKNTSAENSTTNEKHNDTTIGRKEGSSASNNNESGTAETVNIGKDESWDLYSDTPQGGIDGIKNAANGVSGYGYLTNARNIDRENMGSVKNKTNNQGNSSTNNSEENAESARGDKNEIYAVNRETNDEAVGSTRTIDGETGNETKKGTTNVSGMATGNKEIIGKNDTKTVDSEEGVNSLRRDSKGNEAVDFNNTEDYVEHIFGKQGIRSYSKMLEEFRATFLNIDKMIIDELSDLFFGLWE